MPMNAKMPRKDGARHRFQPLLSWTEIALSIALQIPLVPIPWLFWCQSLFFKSRLFKIIWYILLRSFKQNSPNMLLDISIWIRLHKPCKYHHLALISFLCSMELEDPTVSKWCPSDPMDTLLCSMFCKSSNASACSLLEAPHHVEHPGLSYGLPSPILNHFQMPLYLLPPQNYSDRLGPTKWLASMISVHR